MSLTFFVRDLAGSKLNPEQNSIHLIPSNWDDYSFKTSFEAVYYDQSKFEHRLGTLKIGFNGQQHGWTLDNIERSFNKLQDNWFSLGQDVDYYRNIQEVMSGDVKDAYLRSINDFAANALILRNVQDEPVFKDSLTRSVSMSVINGQFKRVLNGQVVLSEFRFGFKDDGDSFNAPLDLLFHVKPDSKPPTNVHVLIGRNGVGKTTLLNNMVTSLVGEKKERCQFFEQHYFGYPEILAPDYFSRVVSVSFSAFDPFLPPINHAEIGLGVAYSYIGMKKVSLDKITPGENLVKNDVDLHDDFIKSLEYCLNQSAKRERWLNAIKRLQSDDNFAKMGLGRLLEVSIEEALQIAKSKQGQMSSGHAIILNTITQLINTVEEKTLILIDEPESHLHPPLLSAFIRAISELLINRNGVAIIATHSPVVVQEVPKSCVWILNRAGLEARADRPERETFGENTGILTREIFGLEVTKSGYHEMLANAVDSGGTYESILKEFNGQLGAEAQGLLSILIDARDVGQR